MAIVSAMSSSFRKECLEAVHNFDVGGDTFKVCLLKSPVTGSYSAASVNYSDVTGNSDELASAGGYTTGGATLTNVSPVLSGTTAYATFSNPSWTSATFTTTGCMIYNTSKGNKAVAVFDFGGAQTVTAGTFQILMPTADATHAVIRIA